MIYVILTFCFFLPNSKVVFLECNSLTCFLKKVYSSKVLFQANVATRKIQSTLCFISHNRVLFTTQACILLYKLIKMAISKNSHRTQILINPFSFWYSILDFFGRPYSFHIHWGCKYTLIIHQRAVVWTRTEKPCRLSFQMFIITSWMRLRSQFNFCIFLWSLDSIQCRRFNMCFLSYVIREILAMVIFLRLSILGNTLLNVTCCIFVNSA